MTKKKLPVSYFLGLLVVIGILVWFGHPRTLDDFMEFEGDVSFTVYYWPSANQSIGCTWEAGSPEAQQAMELLKGTAYSRSLLHELMFRANRVNQAVNGNTGILTLDMDDGHGGNHLIGFMPDKISFDGYNAFVAKDPDLKNKLLAIADP